MALATTFRVVHWYLHHGDDWSFDESYILTDEDETSFCTVMGNPKNAHLSLIEISVCRGKLDFTPGLVTIKKEWPKLYEWLMKRYDEPERMKAIK